MLWTRLEYTQDGTISDVTVKGSVPTAAIYLRLSSDPTGQRDGVDRQRKECSSLARRRGWAVAAERVYEDNDVTGKGTKPRPGFRALLVAIARGEVQVLIAAEWERLERNRREGLELIEAAKAAGILITLVRGSDMDMSTPGGVLAADLFSSIARNEIAVKEARAKSARDQRLDRGQRAGGNRPWGYTRTMEIEPAEATLVRECFDRVLRGETLGAIARDLNARQYYSPFGNGWEPGNLGAALRKECYGGILVSGGKVYGDGSWKPIVDRATWEAVQGILRDPSRRLSPGGAVRNLLSGVAVCGVPKCGARAEAGASSKGKKLYRCSRSAHMTQGRDDVDRHVEAVAVARLMRPDARALFAAESIDVAPLREERKALAVRLDALADDLDMDEMTLARRAKAIRGRMDEISTAIAEATRSSVIAEIVAAPDVPAFWAGLTTDVRRGVIGKMMHVVLMSPGRGARTFDPATVVLTPR